MQRPKKGLHSPLMSAAKIRAFPPKRAGKERTGPESVSLLVSADVPSLEKSLTTASRGLALPFDR